MIFERYEMFASTLNEHFRFVHTFNEDALEHYGYKKFVCTVYVGKCSTTFLNKHTSKCVFKGICVNNVIVRQHMRYCCRLLC